MRTSTGSIRVRKITQNAAARNGKRKYTIANAEITDTAILPTAISAATITEFISMPAIGGAPAFDSPSDSTKR